MDTGISEGRVAGRLDAWALTALDEVATLDGVHRAGLAVIEGGGRRLMFTSSDRPHDASPDWCHIDAFDDVPLTAATRHGRLVAGMLGDLEARYGSFARAKKEAGSVAMAAIPLTAPGAVLGGCLLYFDQAQRFDQRHCRQLTELGAVLGARLQLSRTGSSRREPRLAEPAGPGRLETFEVAAELAALPGARELLRRTLRAWSLEQDVIENAALCLSEMVTNALIHTDGGCQVQVRLAAGLLSVRVHDLGHPVRAVSSPIIDELGGRGLQIVEAMASRSGRDDVDAVSWYELDL